MVDGVWVGVDDWYVGFFEGVVEFQWGLVVVLDDYVFGLFDVDDFKDVFEGYWFEVQVVGGVVVGGDGFWVVVDYNGFVVVFVYCQCCVYVVVVEFDVLVDVVWIVVEDYDFFVV